jgi:alpha-D-xyloside xylohydrolase
MLKSANYILFLMLMFVAKNVSAQKFIKVDDGIIVYPNQNLSGSVHAVKLQVMNDKIIRVIASATDSFQNKSLIILNQPSQKINFTVNDLNDSVQLKTNALIASINKQTGAVSFYDLNGKVILQEKQYNGRNLAPAVFEGGPSYNIQQTFTTTNDDALYGLGQHQDGIVNYRNNQEFLWQNNTEVAVPLLVSSKNYGILWDNYSLTTFGDTRPFQALSSLKLYSKNDEYGFLTASYFNNKNDSIKPDFIKAESDINYPYLNDTKQRLPSNFNVANGKIVWEGSIVSDINGDHTFRFYSAGYFKVWIDGNLVVDKWRQAWNPGNIVVHINFEAGKKYAIKMEWIPDGGESYLSAKCITPVPSSQINDYSFSSEAGKQFDYYFIYGNNADDVIAGYRTLTGKATIPPQWAMGFWQSRERYKTQDEILNTMAEFRKRKVPIDNIVLDWNYWRQPEWGSQQFDETRFPNPDSMIDVLHNKYNAHFMISVWPKFYEGIKAYNEFKKHGWLYTRNVADSQRDWIAQGYVSTFYDAFNADARKGFWDLINQKLYKKGIDAWWMDASEPDILSNVSPQKRKELMIPLALGSAAEYLNAYPLENTKGIYEGQRETNPDKRAFILTRSAFAGSQHYGAAIWSGDISATWGNMKDQIAAGINFSLSGIPYWTMDIGGFATEQRYQNPQGEDLVEWREQNTRWYQFGTFCPLFRVHGQFPYREIYNIAPEGSPAYKSMLYYDKLRYRLMPYIYSLAGWSYVKDYTIMRGLIMDFGNDAEVKNINDEYMFGPSLLINPVYTYKAIQRNVYLPSGQGWYDLYSGKYFEGGQKINADAPYERMPVFVKEGSIISFGVDLQYTNEKPEDKITLYIYAGHDAQFDLYEDEDTNYNYEQGKYSIIPIKYNEQTKTLTIGKREGSFDGMLAKRTFNIVWITKDKPVALNFDVSEKSVLYKGDEVSEKMK